MKRQRKIAYERDITEHQRPSTMPPTSGVYFKNALFIAIIINDQSISKGISGVSKDGFSHCE
jgi:hypothetical protein